MVARQATFYIKIPPESRFLCKFASCFGGSCPPEEIIIMIRKAVILGTGNVAWQLAHSLPLFGYCVVQIFGRNAAKAEDLASAVGADHTDSYDEIYPDADIYIYAVADDAISEVVASVRLDSGVHVHTSGCVGIDVFEGSKSNYGVVYPFQTFTRNKKIDFSKVAIFFEANNDNSRSRVEEFAKALSLKVFESNSEQRRSVHLAGVVGCNFANYLWSISYDILRQQGYPFRDVMLPLIEESLDKLRYMSPSEAQTGPARRGDTGTIAAHEALLADNSDIAAMYRMLSKMIADSSNYKYDRNRQ